MTVEAFVTEPIAVVGMGCRFAPDLSSPEDLWRFLVSEGDAVRGVPADRWASFEERSPLERGVLRNATRHAAYLDDVQGFDAVFFGISPLEALYIDPQQRLALEVAWEALEHAGIPPDSLRGTDAGVYIGVTFGEYGLRTMADLADIQPWAGLGAAYYAVPNRISYLLDLRGPSLAVDTACASSLSGVHLACQSLRTGESSLVIAGGVSVLSAPHSTVALDAMGVTAPDGRSKAFSADADGYGRGEGVGIVVLKRLGDALAAGDRVWAVIRSSVVQHDGKTDAIMIPGREAQENMLRDAYRRAGIAPEHVDYIEAHGTGTPVGDPIEAAALGAVVGAGRPASDPCLIGSVKPNIGHLEAGAGVAGLIKAVLAVHHARIPPTTHCPTPNPSIDWEAARLRVATSLTSWPRTGQPRRAGVSSYGYGGVIAHVVLEQAPVPIGHREHQVADRMPMLFPVSGSTAAARGDNARHLADWLSSHPQSCLPCLGHTLSRRRNHLQHRSGVVANTSEALRLGLGRLAEGKWTPVLAVGSVAAGRPVEPVWVFSGHGAQWPGMGRDLLATEPAFAAAVDELGAVFRDELAMTARELLAQEDFSAVELAQPVAYVMHIGLAALWRSYGVRPGAVIGHSVGEIAAAVVSGALTPVQGAQVVCRRSRLFGRVDGQGAMALVGLPFATVEEQLSGRTDVVTAIHASPESTVISGTEQAVTELYARWRDEGLVAVRVNSSVAFHSPQVDCLIDDLVADLAGLTPRAPSLPAYTSTLADPRSAAVRDGRFWAANMRHICRFSPAVAAAVADGHRLFLEISSLPLVTHSLEETLSHLGVEDGVVAHTLRRDRPVRDTFLKNLATLHCNGSPIAWDRLHPEGELLELPTNAWQHRPYWAEPAPGVGARGGHNPAAHTLLGPRQGVGGEPIDIWCTRLDDASRPYPGRHPVHGVEIVPAAALLATFLETGSPERPVRALTDIALKTPVALTPPREVQVIRHADTVKLLTRIADEASTAPSTWLTHTTATLSYTDLIDGQQFPDFHQVRDRCQEPLTGHVERLLADIGADGIGFDWQAVDLRRGTGEMTARMTLGSRSSGTASWATLFDAAVSLTPLVLPDQSTQRMPARIRTVAVHGDTPPAEINVVARLHPHTPAEAVDVWVTDANGRPVACIIDITFGLLDVGSTQVSDPQRLLHEMTWRPLPLPSGSGHRLSQIVLVGDHTGLAEQLTTACAARGIRFLQAQHPNELPGLIAKLTAPTEVIVTPALPTRTEDLAQSAADAVSTLTETCRWLAAHQGGSTRLWCLTRGVRNAGHLSAAAHASLWGAGRVIANEHPDLWAGTIDIPVDGPDRDLTDQLLQVLSATPGEDVLSLVDGEVHAPRLAVIEREPDRGPLVLKPEGTYLVTGGLGSLGLEAARWLVTHGARRLVLAGRTPLPPRTQWCSVLDPQTRSRIDTITELEALGVTVRTLALDIADQPQATRLLTPESLGLPPIRGIVHAAGVLNDQLIDHLEESSLRAVLRPKIGGALTLHTLFPPGTIDFLFLFSSCGQLFQVPGQTAYAAGNSFLDTLAAHRAPLDSMTTTSLAWTAWRDGGMASAHDAIAHLMQAHGTSDLSTPEALRAWDLATRIASPYLAILPILPLPVGTTRLPVFSELSPTDTSAGHDTPQKDGPPDWTGLSAAEAQARIHSIVTDAVATTMRLPTTDIDPRCPLVEMGIDSVMTMKIRGILQRKTGISLPANLLWQRPTTHAITAYIHDTVTSTREHPQNSGSE
ncbi:type I polyketide synthase [Streptomyces sp. UNOB3_S3]|uniref:type I polyketide synthase n=1 Tax=Streptomyces sp. UNOB3_S3 TaxID=2871682 RepID=UPI001E50B148|nr:type I polyketide synthase [Streptomyces sp. UNOB3_S3]